MVKDFANLKMLEAMAAIPHDFWNALAFAAEYLEEEDKDKEINLFFKKLNVKAAEIGGKIDLPFEKITMSPFQNKEVYWTPLQIHRGRLALEAGADPESIQANRAYRRSFENI